MSENRRKRPGKWQMGSNLQNVTAAEHKRLCLHGITGSRQISGLWYFVHALACNKKPQER